jgi:class 3 adenylate cyclase
MTEKEARTIYEKSCTDRSCTLTSNGPRPQPDGSWRFVEIEEPGTKGRYAGIVVCADGAVFPFDGALGKVFRIFPKLGAPRSGERSLGATAFGRYQAFENGVAIWEGGEDIAFPILESLSPLRRQMCIVAFFDLRGFTSWSTTADSDQVQRTIHGFEDAVHIGFPTTLTSLPRLFLKGTGDGVMIVSQADWHRDAQLHETMTTFTRGHALDFLSVCERVVSVAHQQLLQSGFPLGIGCGIACGALDRVFLFGRFDFLGCAANEAAKLQQHAWNEICVTDEFRAILKLDGRASDADWELASKGWRLRADEIYDAQPPAAADAPKSARR